MEGEASGQVRVERYTIIDAVGFHIGFWQSIKICFDALLLTAALDGIT
jgi:hypothetical protein